jgi:ubiquinone/menaquinone biosynthesis C-methylase UbiE
MTLSARRGLAALIVVCVTVGLTPAARSATSSPRGANPQWNLDIERAMDAIGLTIGMVVGEAGAGDGYFTFPMARRVGTTGIVLANDISKRALEALDRRRVSEHVANIQTVEGSVDDPLFPRRDLQVVVVVHAFHDFSSPVEWLVNLKKYLRPGASLVVIDRDPAQGAESHFWPKERIVGHAREAGYALTKAVDDISAHLILVFKVQEKPGQRP